MYSLLIIYDLKKPGRDYTPLYKSIYTATKVTPLAESVWLIKSTEDCAYWRDKLKAHLDANDALAVLNLGNGWATIGVNKNVTDWMKVNL